MAGRSARHQRVDGILCRCRRENVLVLLDDRVHQAGGAGGEMLEPVGGFLGDEAGDA